MSHHWGYMAVIASAFLFGIGTTINKLLLEYMSPALIVGVTYLIGGFVLGCSSLLPRTAKLTSWLKVPERTKTEFVWRDLAVLMMIVLSGAVIAPYLFMLGLNNTTAVNAALLGNTESLFTIGIAFIFLGERGSLKDYAAMLLLILGAVVLTTNLSFRELNILGPLFGNLLVIGGCLFWGIDNNLSRLVTVKRSLPQLGSVKGILGGSIMLVIAVFGGLRFIPNPLTIIYAVVVGVFSVGLSLLLFLFSLQEMGAMRTGVIFSTSSFFGAVSAFLILHESISLVQILAGLVMLFAIYVLSISKKDTDQR